MLVDNRIITVDLSHGSADYTSVNEAIRAAADGDTIVLRAGSYEEKILLDKGVHIAVDPEAEPGDTIVTSGCIATANAVGASITNLVIQQLVDIRGGNLLLQNCELTQGSDGVRICTGANPTIRQCKIHNCLYAGIYVQEGGSGLITGCDISNIKGGDGIHCKGSSEALQIKENSIHDCAAGNGIYFRKAAKGLVEGNVISTIQQFGIYIQSGSDPVVARNQVELCGIHCLMVSKEGNGSIKDNSMSGSVRIYKGCAPVLGANVVTGTLDTEA